MFNAFQKLRNLIGNKLENYFVNTNDSKFDDVKEIIGNDNYTDGKPYLITNAPTGGSNYIQNGRRHTILGLEYDNQNFGFQVSYGTQKILYRTKENNVWSQWQSLTQNITTGTEYETGRIIDSRKEYGLRINCGDLLSSGSKIVETGLTGVTYTSIDGVATTGGSWPYKMGAPGTGGVVVLEIQENKIKITCNSDLSAYSGYVELKYLKN